MRKLKKCGRRLILNERELEACFSPPSSPLLGGLCRHLDLKEFPPPPPFPPPPLTLHHFSSSSSPSDLDAAFPMGGSGRHTGMQRRPHPQAPALLIIIIVIIIVIIIIVIIIVIIIIIIIKITLIQSSRVLKSPACCSSSQSCEC